MFNERGIKERLFNFQACRTQINPTGDGLSNTISTQSFSQMKDLALADQ